MTSVHQGSLLVGDDVPRSSALLSDDGAYRYRLTRTWDDRIAAACFIMLNPSTADAMQDDPTIRRCIGYAKAWGAGGVNVANLYAYRATKPADLWKAADPVGPDNDEHLESLANYAARYDRPLVAAWGANARADRVAQVVGLIGHARLTALAVTASGQPRHPLYLRADLTPKPWVAS